MPKAPKQKIGYVLRRFPAISETFILNEVLGVEGEGAPVEIYSILQPRDPKYHHGVTRLDASIRYIPNMADLKGLWRYNRKAQQRFGREYWQMFFRCAATFRPMLMWRFFQGAYVAERAVASKITRFHAHFANRATTVARLASELSGIPYSFTAHAVDIFKQPLDKKLLTKKIDGAAQVVTVSESNKAYLEQFTPENPDKITRIYNGIDLQKFVPPTTRPMNTPLEILCVARFVEKKGLDILIDSLAQLSRSGLDFRCKIIGKGLMRQSLVEQIKGHGLSDKIKLLGVHTQNVMVYRYHAADFFVLPCVVGEDGNRDGLPVAIVEALACGLPVIATSVTGIPEAVKDGVNGVIVPEGDREALAEAIRAMMTDETQRMRLSIAAPGSIQERFCKQQTIKHLVAVLNASSRTLDQLNLRAAAKATLHAAE